MLSESLKVVEAVRQLRLVVRNDRTIADVSDPVELAFSIDAVRRALETFDESVRNGRGRASIQARPDFATPPQMDDDGFDVVDHNLSAEYTPEREADILESELEETEDQIEAREEAERLRMAGIAAVAVAGAAPVVFPLRTGLRPSDLEDDLVDGVFVSDDTVEQLEMGLDLIEDRLGFAVRRVGWSPRLKGLAEAAIQALGHLDLLVDKERDEASISMPAQSFSDLMRHVTDVTVNHDLKITLPVPRPEAGRSARLEETEKRKLVMDDDALIDDDMLDPFSASM